MLEQRSATIPALTGRSRAVGYTSASHFIREFRGRFGTTPRDYADAHRLGRDPRAARAEAG